MKYYKVTKNVFGKVQKLEDIKSKQSNSEKEELFILMPVDFKKNQRVNISFF